MTRTARNRRASGQMAPRLHHTAELDFITSHTVEAVIRTAFQPIMSAQGNVVAYEALLRFREGLDKPESRETMIRRWEDCGYIGTVDVSVLKQATAALDLLHSSLMVSVNVSMVTLNTDRARYLRHLDNAGDKAKRLIVEVTNTA